MSLNDRQRRFIHNKVMGLSNIDAYRKAGYNPRTDEAASSASSRILAKPEAQKYLRELREEVRSEQIMEETELLATLSEIARGEVEHEEPMYVEKPLYGEGKHGDTVFLAVLKKPTIETLKTKTSDRLRALDLLGKYYGLFKERIEPTGDITITLGEWDENDEEDAED